MGGVALGCAETHGHAHSHVGESDSVEQSDQGRDGPKDSDETIGVTSAQDLNATSENDRDSTAERDAATKSTEEKPEDPPTYADIPILEAPEVRDERLAQAALARVTGSDNHLGLKMAIVERASDLPWILAIQNTSEKDVNLAALPELLRLEVSKAPAADQPEGAPPAEAPKPIVCSAKPPKKLSNDDTVLLPAGTTLHYSFDPTTLCSEPSLLAEGDEVRAVYGFAVTKKKVWQKGKMVEIEETDKAPFVAERAEEATDMVGLKELTAPSFVLGSTYPLEKMLAAAREEEAAFRKQQAEALGEDAPVEPVEVSLAPLGTSSDPEEGLIRVSVKNVSDKSVQIYLRREHFAYRVSGPGGSTTCQMFPVNPAATEISFNSLSPGSSLSLSTRLAEACPKGTWGPPGDYQVAVVFSPNQTGQEFKKDAYVGIVRGKNTTTLTIPGEKRPKMRVSAPTK